MSSPVGKRYPEGDAGSDAERRPLVISVEPCFAQRTLWDALVAVPALALRWHPAGLCVSFGSSILNWVTGHAEVRSIDALMFKSIFVVLGLTLGFRLARANVRSGEAQGAIKDLLESAISLIVLVPDQSREKCAEHLLYLLDVFWCHLESVSNRTNFWFNLLSLRPVDETFVDRLNNLSCTARPGKTDAYFSPRTLMVSVMCYFGEVIATNAPRPLEFMWRDERTKFMRAYDTIETLATPSVCDNYVLMIDVLLSTFATCLPWGIGVQSYVMPTGLSSTPQIRVSGGILLCANVLTCTIVLFGLNGLARETEDPVDGFGPDDIDVRQAFTTFDQKVREYVRCRRSSHYGAVPGRSGWESAIDVHKRMVPAPNVPGTRAVRGSSHVWGDWGRRGAASPASGSHP